MFYTLEAVQGTTRRKKTINAESELDATFEAIQIILEKAADDPAGIWSVGRIVLSDSEGRTIHYMDAK